MVRGAPSWNAVGVLGVGEMGEVVGGRRTSNVASRPTVLGGEHSMIPVTIPHELATGEVIELRPLTDPPDDYTIGWIHAWELAHDTAGCGHARANWKDPKYGTPEYDGDERCEVCELLK